MLGWEPEIDLEEGLRAGSRRSAGSRSRPERGTLGVIVAARRGGAARVECASGSLRRAYLRVGIYDEAQTLYGPVDQTFALFKQLHVQEVRLNLYWGGPYGVAKARPAHATESGRPGLQLGALRPHRQLRAAGGRARAVLDLRHAALGERRARPERRTDERDRPRNFAYAAAKRYSGKTMGADGRLLPAVREWLAWNEPNNPVFLTPQ